MFCIFFLDLNVQIQALNQVLDKLDYHIDEILEEIIRIRIPEASYAVIRYKKKKNNLWWTGAILSAGGQFLREIHKNWDLQDNLPTDEFYPQLLGKYGFYISDPKAQEFQIYGYVSATLIGKQL